MINDNEIVRVKEQAVIKSLKDRFARIEGYSGVIEPETKEETQEIQQREKTINEIVLGAKYQDKITGFSGTATGHVKYISGCNQTLLVPRVGEDGKLVDAQWFDDQRLERTSEEIIELDNGSSPGFDIQAPIR